MLSTCNTDTTPTQPHRNSNTHRTKNNTTNVVIQRSSRKLLMMDILISETCWAHKKWNKIASDIKSVFYSSTIQLINLTFREPCIVMYSYNKSQQDALFLKFIVIKDSTYFGQIYCASSGVSTLYTQQWVLSWYLCWLSARADLSETCRVPYQTKLEKQCILLAFIVRTQKPLCRL